ncbi:MAG TPA: hypothetical protein DCE41_32445 [Cytophagales bacterium]|nr:hypothetical protein [Cytophagales bacterium]HAA19297.1 hypothetical protein [Cytophagales bacterium]HAP64822.1 hypothetical protein [Cytophagales bacterium]
MDKIRNYNLEAPSKQKTLEVFTGYFNEEYAESLWNEACEATATNPEAESLTELEQIFTYFCSIKGKVGVQGMSMKMRLMTYRNLLALQTNQSN